MQKDKIMKRKSELKFLEGTIFGLFLSLILMAFTYFIWECAYKPKEPVSHYSKAIDLPEEIGLAEEGDLLQVIRIEKDSLFLGFKN